MERSLGGTPSCHICQGAQLLCAKKILMARKSAGASSAEEGLECGFMSSHSHKVTFLDAIASPCS